MRKSAFEQKDEDVPKEATLAKKVKIKTSKEIAKIFSQHRKQEKML